MNTIAIDPTFTALALAIKLAHAADVALHRAVDRALEQLQLGTPCEFDGDELRVVSASRRSEGAIQVATADSCSCEGSRHPWCWHRALARLLFASAAIQSPASLRAAIVEQTAPADLSPADELDLVDDYPF